MISFPPDIRTVHSATSVGHVPVFKSAYGGDRSPKAYVWSGSTPAGNGKKTLRPYGTTHVLFASTYTAK